MTGRVLVVAAGLVLMLAGCMTDGDAYGSPYGSRHHSPSRSYDRYDYEEPRRLGNRASAALAEGCRQRFYPGTSKYSQCIRGERKSDDSLVEGCTRLYKNDPKNYRRCMQGN